MPFDINGGEWLVLLLVAVVVIGPERLPAFAEQLGRWVRGARGFLTEAKARVDAELGEEAKDVDWAALDPRQYDPRRIVREALLDDDGPRGRAPANPRNGARTATPRTGAALRTGATAVGAAVGAAAAGSAAAGTAAGASAGTAASAAPPAPFDTEAT
ncbi:twin-arginine translocase TatA/TatE family subunit [Cellulomonas marina]|uniref:Sec-independent protein translocase protein TatB n=1 Tax=Cellulomonas marina TaxID=988821 RepID=A0A1I0ZIK8_9CELL|nr:twin-arginine translocase TatA/TatE family subunit [Cellulomonas marina]GIG28621.1 hypothetical protein Cma02nite_12210 [Cellulomonas marina]SFB25504.1 sec-independent protein translocase protein TatB [Cellulomonas marina]